MKKRIFWIGIIVIVLGIVIAGVFCTNYSILHLSPTMCGITLEFRLKSFETHREMIRGCKTDICLHPLIKMDV